MIIIILQYWVSSGNARLQLQELRRLPDAAAETEGGAEREWVLHAAPSASPASGTAGSQRGSSHASRET